ncbi:arylesterase [Rhodanobacter ginsengiterrae]|uniref:arylesterase n=1 Tax=Rhodanobacter ginsengiterrae TaxID=2008451 RepID=UPI003CF87E86
MRRSPGWWLCSVLLLGWFGAAQAASPKTVLVLGDSLSAAHNIPVESGWVHLLDARLSNMVPKWTAVNASISGETSLSGRNRLPALLTRYRPAVLIIELGANDGLRGLPLPALRANLEVMIVAAQQAKVRVLLVGIELPVNYGPQYRDGLRAIYAELALSHRTALVPFLLEGVALDPAKMQDDGLHPVAAAEPAVLDTVWKQLQPLLRESKTKQVMN